MRQYRPVPSWHRLWSFESGFAGRGLDADAGQQRTTCSLVSNKFSNKFRPSQPGTSHSFLKRKADRRPRFVAHEPASDLGELMQRLLPSTDSARRRASRCRCRYHRTRAPRRFAASQVGQTGCMSPARIRGARALDWQEGWTARLFRRTRAPFPATKPEPLRQPGAVPTNERRRHARASFSTSSNGRTPESIRCARRASSVMPESSRAAWYCQTLKDGAVGTAKQLDFPQRLHQGPVDTLSGESGDGGDPGLEVISLRQGIRVLPNTALQVRQLRLLPP